MQKIVVGLQVDGHLVLPQCEQSVDGVGKLQVHIRNELPLELHVALGVSWGKVDDVGKGSSTGESMVSCETSQMVGW